MPVVIIRHKVKDFATWKKAFDAHQPTREGTGLSKSRVLRSADDASEVVLIFDAADINKVKAFVASAELQSAMQLAGVVDKPDVYFLNPVD
jgi:hypothetical protein